MRDNATPISGLREILKRRGLRQGAAIFFATWLIYMATGIATSGDSRWSLPIAFSVLREGNFDIAEYAHEIQPENLEALEFYDGRPYSMFPIGTPLLATPFVAVMNVGMKAVLALAPGLETYLRSRSPEPDQPITLLTFYWRIEQIIASFYAALAVVVMWRVALKTLAPRLALLAAGLFAFATTMWSAGSTALWQHGPSALALSICLLLLFKAKKDSRWIPLIGFTLACAYVIRPTNSISVTLISAYVAWRYPRRLPLYLACAAVIAIPWLLYNWSVYAALFPPYYRYDRLGSPLFLEALAGNLVSPARGLFVYIPLVFFSMTGAALLYRRRWTEPFDAFLLPIPVIHWIVISSFPHWWAGWAYGPRYFADMAAYFIYFLLPVLRVLPEWIAARRHALVGAFALCALWCVLIQYRGASTLDTWMWNRDPVNVDHNPGRLWEWSDPPFLRGW